MHSFVLLYMYVNTKEMSVHSTKQITSRGGEFEANKAGNIFFTTVPGSRATAPCSHSAFLAFLAHRIHTLFFDTDGHQVSALNASDKSGLFSSDQIFVCVATLCRNPFIQ